MPEARSARALGRKLLGSRPMSRVEGRLLSGEHLMSRVGAQPTGPTMLPVISQSGVAECSRIWMRESYGCLAMPCTPRLANTCSASLSRTAVGWLRFAITTKPIFWLGMKAT